MRFYGMRSGRNNMSGLIARSILYNSNKSKKNKEQEVEYSPLFYVISFIVVVAIYALIFG